MQYLVVMRMKPTASREELAPLYKPEAAKAWELMAAGVLRSIHFITGPAGAVLLFEASGEKEVEAHVAPLPLVAAGAVTVEILPLEPFTGWALLFAKEGA